jgi:hypothetical protein
LGVLSDREMEYFYTGLELGGGGPENKDFQMRRKIVKDTISLFPPSYETVEGIVHCTLRTAGYENEVIKTQGETDLEAYQLCSEALKEYYDSLWVPPSVKEKQLCAVKKCLEKYGIAKPEEIAEKFLGDFRQCLIDKNSEKRVLSKGLLQAKSNSKYGNENGSTNKDDGESAGEKPSLLAYFMGTGMQRWPGADIGTQVMLFPIPERRPPVRTPEILENDPDSPFPYASAYPNGGNAADINLATYRGWKEQTEAYAQYEQRSSELPNKIFSSAVRAKTCSAIANDIFGEERCQMLCDFIASVEIDEDDVAWRSWRTKTGRTLPSIRERVVHVQDEDLQTYVQYDKNNLLSSLCESIVGMGDPKKVREQTVLGRKVSGQDFGEFEFDFVPEFKYGICGPVEEHEPNSILLQLHLRVDEDLLRRELLKYHGNTREKKEEIERVIKRYVESQKTCCYKHRMIHQFDQWLRDPTPTVERGHERRRNGKKFIEGSDLAYGHTQRSPTLDMDYRRRRNGKLFIEGSDLAYGHTQRITEAAFIKLVMARDKVSEKEARAEWGLYQSGKRRKGGKGAIRARGEGSKKINSKPPPRASASKTAVNKALALNKKKGPNPQGNMPVKLTMNSMMKTILSDCAAWYLHAQVNPFYPIDGIGPVSAWWKKTYGTDPQPACIPTYPASPSRKLWQITRFNFSTGASGGGMLALAPVRLANNYSGAFNSNCPIAVSSTAWGGNGSVFATMDSWAAVAPDAGINMLNVSSEFTQTDLAFVGSSADLNNVVKYRPVSVGMRVKYIGTAMNRSGTIHCVHTPNHESLSGLTIDYLSNTPSYFAQDVTDNWVTLQYCVVDPEEVEYKMDGIVNSAAITSQNAGIIATRAVLNHYMGFMIFGSFSQPWSAEIIQHFEVIGPPIVGKTKTNVDIGGLSAVSNVINPANVSVMSQHPKVIEEIARTQPSTVTELGENLLDQGVKVGKTLLEKVGKEGFLDSMAGFLAA